MCIMYVQYISFRICTLTPNPDQQGYNLTDLLLVAGKYYLLFEVVLMDVNNVKVDIDNITLLNENCTYEIIEEGKHW